MPSERPPKVFISYSQDSPEHMARVLKLADQLRTDGVDAEIDQYEFSPPEGWPNWMQRQIRDADFILVVCSATYLAKVESKVKPGVKWESLLSYQQIYDNDSDSSRFIPVLLEGGKYEHIPSPMRNSAYYRPEDDAEYEKLLRHITNQPASLRPRLGPLAKLPPAHIKTKANETASDTSEPQFQTADVKVHVHTFGGDVHLIEAPLDIRVYEFIQQVVSGLHLPSVDADGHSIVWIVDDHNTGKELDYSLTLQQNGVQNWHHLYLARWVTAGGGGPGTLDVSHWNIAGGPEVGTAITINVVTSNGAHTFFTPVNISTQEFITRVLAEVNLQDDSGTDFKHWQIVDSGRRTLNPSISLAENGIGEGDTLYVQQLAGAGGSLPKDSSVQFTVYTPQTIAVEKWYTLLAYVHIPEAAQKIQAQAIQSLGYSAAGYDQLTGSATTTIKPNSEITVIPVLPGCKVNPRQASFLWVEEWHKVEFRFQALAAQQLAQEMAATGQVAFYVGPILIGEITFPLHLGSPTSPGFSEKSRMTKAPGYEAIFVSYSHKDTLIVEELERAYTVLGMQYLRDIKVLRSGEKWNEALLEKIQEADIFQLCWSHSAKQSENVTREWKHALTQSRPAFIRPCYWEKPMPDPPEELADLHFACLEWDGQRFRPRPEPQQDGRESSISKAGT